MKNLLIEFLGTFFLTLAIALVSGNPLAVGLVLLAVSYVGRHLSGAYYNPALVIAGWRRGSLEDDRLLPYLVAQILGALLALVFVMHAFKIMFVHPMATEVHPAVVLSFEVLLAFVFSLVFLTLGGHSSLKDNHVYGIVIGLTLAGLATLGGLFNPAIALGSVGLELLNGGFDKINPLYLGVFVLGPLVGGFLAAYAYEYFNKGR